MIQTFIEVNSPDLILNNDLFNNDEGNLRLSLVRLHFGLCNRMIGCKYDKLSRLIPLTVPEQTRCLTLSDLEDITSLYVGWRDLVEYLPLRLTYENLKSGDLYKVWQYNKLCKRGNDVYIDQIRKRFSVFIESDNIIFFDPAYVGVRKRKSKTPALYITLEFNSNEYEFTDAWFNVSKYWNSFITNLRQKFKGCSIVFLRGYHAHETGYPHIHALIYFEGIEFTAVRHVGTRGANKGEVSFRLPTRLNDKQRIKDCWEHGFVDIRCVSETSKGFTDIMKYCTNEFGSGKGKSDLNNAMLWYFGKQSFAMSKNFIDVVGMALHTEQVSCIENLDANEINAPLTYNSNSVLRQIEIFPTNSLESSSFDGSVLVVFDKKPPDDFDIVVEKLIFDCSVSVHTRDDGVQIIMYKKRRLVY